MTLHAWWTTFGKEVETADELSSVHARDFTAAVKSGAISGARVIGFRQDGDHSAVPIEIDVERPQELAFPIKATEPLAVIFGRPDEQPRVLALREDFPDTPHQNWTPEGAPCSLCIDDRPWAEARLTSTAFDFVRRIQLWLAKAARGELHDPAQPLDPLFFHSWLSLVIPPSVFGEAGQEPPELVGFTRQDNPGIILTARAAAAGGPRSGEARFLVLAFQAAPQAMSRLRHAPTTLMGLNAELSRCGIDLLKELKSRLATWAGMTQDDLRRLGSRLVILVAFPVQAGADRTVNDFRAFVTPTSAGDIGVALGVLLKHPTQVGNRQAYTVAIGGNAPHADQIAVDAAEVHFSLNRDLSAAIAGRKADRRQAVLVGAGALGSQIGLNLAREGALSWIVLDQDILMPHNLARHGLLAADTGAPKAFAVARQMGMLLDEPFEAARCDVTRLDAEIADQVNAHLAAADIIIDASASVAVSRFISDLGVSAKRLCAFFNPAGNAAVLMAEDKARSVTLRDLEAQYHGLLFSDPSLADHLKTDRPGVRYSGSCRALTNRIPATRAALLSALAARGISDCLRDDDASIRIWTTTDEGEVKLVRRAAAQVTSRQFGSWTLRYDAGVLQTLREYRACRLPNETGGILLGMIDVSRRSIHVAHAMPEPEDSQGSVTGFERGVLGLAATVADVAEKSLHQIRYVGEWHSHPVGSSVMPSRVDIAQLEWLSSELEAEGVPALMAIAGDDGAFSFMLVEEAGKGNLTRRAS